MTQLNSQKGNKRMSKTKITLSTTGIVVGSILVLIVLGAIALGIRWIFAGPTGQVEAREQTLGSGSYRIQAYDHFFNLCASVQTTEGQIGSLEQELKTKPSKARVEQIQASLTAIRSNRIASINQYNADAAKSYTIGQFKDADLPFSLDPTTKETTCVL